MIEKLRKRFFIISFIAMTAVMILVTGAINVINYLDVRAELNATLMALAENEGGPLEDIGDPRLQGRDEHQRNMMRESNFFSGTWNAERGVELMGPDQKDQLYRAEHEALIEQAARSGESGGTIGQYIFLRMDSYQEETVRLVFLNTETRMNQVYHVLYFSIGACLVGILVAMFAIGRFSRRAIEPILKNDREQKQFITDASHELKTPLTVISANMDVLSMDVPGNTWIRSTQKQVAQMRRLVDELVYLSRLEERDHTLEMVAVNLSEQVEEVAEPFAAMAEFQSKKMDISAGRNLYVRGDTAALQRMLSTLCDNAVKYAREEGEIGVELLPEGRQLRLRFSNTVAEPLTEEQCERLFQRFYRADASRSKGKSGFGIGLAIARAIVEKHGGSIGAAMEDDRLVITCLLPAGAEQAEKKA